MLRRIIAVSLSLMACGASATTAPLTPAKSPPPSVPVQDTSSDWVVSPDRRSTRLKNPEGVQAYVVPVTSKSDPTLRDHYLLRITGSDSPNDGLVVLAQRRTTYKRTLYVAQLAGESFDVLRVEKATPTHWHGRAYQFQQKLNPLEATQDAFDPEELVRLRSEQRGSKLREIEAESRADIERWQNAFHKKELEAVVAACGPFKSSIDWSTVDKEWPAQFSIAEACRLPLKTLQDFCELYPSSVADRSEKFSLRCKFTGDPRKVASGGLSKEGPTSLVYTPGKSNDLWKPLMQALRVEFHEDEQVLRLGSLHFIIKYGLPSKRLSYGDGKTFYLLRDQDASYREAFDWLEGGQRGQIALEDGRWSLYCGRNGRQLEALAGKERQAVLDAAVYATELPWKHTEHFLARDSRGTYYYVDKYKSEFGGGHYRVFIGRKGQMKLSKLVGLVEDNEGTLFSTAKGDLRLIIDRGSMSAIWIRGKKSTSLTTVDIGASAKLIYDDLGVYYGEKVGFVCN